MNKKVLSFLTAEVALVSLIFLNLPQFTFFKGVLKSISSVMRFAPRDVRDAIEFILDLFDMSNPMGGVVTILLSLVLLGLCAYSLLRHYAMDGNRQGDDPWCLPADLPMLCAGAGGALLSMVTGGFMFTRYGASEVWWLSLLLAIPALVFAFVRLYTTLGGERDGNFFANRIFLLTMVAAAAKLSGVPYAGLVSLTCTILLLVSAYKPFANYLDDTGYQAMIKLHRATFISLVCPLVLTVAFIILVILAAITKSPVIAGIAFVVFALGFLVVSIYVVVLLVMAFLRLRRSVFFGVYGQWGASFLIVAIFIPTQLLTFVFSVAGWGLITYSMYTQEVIGNLQNGQQLVPPQK